MAIGLAVLRKCDTIGLATARISISIPKAVQVKNWEIDWEIFSSYDKD
jgi:hypothetical protein